MTVLLTRHGAHDEVGKVLSGRSEIGLNEVGCEQAIKLASRLSSAPLTKVYSSPRRRTKETAALVAALHGLEVIEVNALDEIDFGDWAGKSFRELESDPRWCRWNKARGHAATPGGDTMASVTARASQHLEADQQQGCIVCVSHCDVIRGIIAHYLGLDFDRLLSFDIDPASVSTIELYGGAGRVIALNERVS